MTSESHASCGHVKTTSIFTSFFMLFLLTLTDCIFSKAHETSHAWTVCLSVSVTGLLSGPACYELITLTLQSLTFPRWSIMVWGCSRCKLYLWEYQPQFSTWDTLMLCNSTWPSNKGGHSNTRHTERISRSHYTTVYGRMNKTQGRSNSSKVLGRTGGCLYSFSMLPCLTWPKL